jgi:hypothetical protein
VEVAAVHGWLFVRIGVANGGVVRGRTHILFCRAQWAAVSGAGISSAVAVGRVELPRAFALPTVPASTAASEAAY